jgi:hypothetical protein
MKPEVEAAIEQLKDAGVGTEIRTKPDTDGGAYVIVDDVTVGDAFEPTTSWVGFHIVWSYPDADVYPHFLDAGLRYVGSGSTPNQHADGKLPKALTRGAKMPGFDLPAIQVSRRSNHRDAQSDSALQKLLRVVAFLESR